MNDVLDTRFAHAFAARLHDAVNAHDADAIAALCTDDVEWNDPAETQPLRRRDAVARVHRDEMFRALPDVRIEATDGPYVSVDGCGIAARALIRSTMSGPLDPPGFAATGSEVEFQTAEFSQIRDGLLARHTVILDMLDLARQIGAVPNPGSVADRLGVWMQRVGAFWSRNRRAHRR